MNTTSLQLKVIEPTVFFVQTAQGLTQAVDLVIWNAAEAVNGSVAVKFGSQEEHMEIGKIAPGEGTYRAYIPDIRESVPIEFVLLADGKIRDRYSMTWMPQRCWQVYMIPIAHHDFGYTDTIENRRQEMPRENVSLDGQWQIALDPGNVGKQEKWFAENVSGSQFHEIRVPSCWEEKFPFYDGVGWYRREFDAPQSRVEYAAHPCQTCAQAIC